MFYLRLALDFVHGLVENRGRGRMKEVTGSALRFILVEEFERL